MRKLAITLALASSALASPALARDNSWYVGVDGGVTLVEDIRFDIGTVKRASSVDNHAGVDLDGNVGYDFGPFRVEAEVGYKQLSIDGYTSSVPTGAGGRTFAAGAYSGAGGRTTALSFMLNGLLDFGDDDSLQGFVGGGVGVARVSERVGLSRSTGNFVDDSDTAFAYQGLAGIRAPLTDHIDAKLEYRFFTVDDVKLVDVTNRTLNGRYRSHSILGGVTYNFGTPTPPAPPAPPPPPPLPPEPTPPPPVPQATPCTPGPFIVFFEWDKSDITPEAASILDNAISNYQNCGNAQVMLAGHADRSGAASYNVGLSQRRADSVKAYFTAHSIPEGIIQTQAFGESRPRVETADGVREVQNRRVEIMYGPSAGQ